MLKILVDFIGMFILTSAIFYGLSLINNKKINKKIFFLICIVYAVIMLLLSNYAHSILKITTNFIIFVIVNVILFKQKIFNGIFNAFIIFVLLMVSDILTSFIFMNFAKINIEMVRSNLMLQAAVNISTSLILLLLVNIKSIYKLLPKIKEIPKSQIIVFAIYILITILMFSINLIIYSDQNELNQYYFISNISTAIYFILSMIFVYQLLKQVNVQKSLDRVENRYNQLKIHTDTIENLLEELRIFKHDYDNRLFAIKGYINESNSDGLNNYIKQLIDESKLLPTTYINKLKNINNPAIKGVMASKIINMMALDLKVQINISENIDNINMPERDIIRVFGILLDNALEGAKKAKEGVVSISVVKYEEDVNIVINNSCSDVIDTSMIAQKGYSTKGDNRGYGLYILNNIIDSYDNSYLLTICEDNMFTQDLLIKGKKELRLEEIIL